MKSQKGGRKASSLPLDTVEYLKAWMMSPEHIAHPYPTEQEKAQIMAETGIEMKQLTNWFVNNRKRFWKPRVESAQFKKSIANAPSPRAHPSSNKNDGQLGIANHRPKRNKPEKQATSFLPSSSGSSSTRGRGRASSFGKPAYIQEVDDDTHPISDGSSYSQSDDDSLASSGGSHRSTNFGVIAQQYLDSLAKANSSSIASSDGKRKDEQVEVLILRPESSTSNGSTDSEDSLPTIRDVTIRSSAPENRILATFKCHISYTIPKEIEHDKKKVQTRRDGEVLKMKKHYLKLYLATRGIHSVSTPPTGSDAGINAGTVSSASSVSSMTESTSSTSRQTNAISPVAKRTHVFGKEEEITPRKRARTLSGSFVEGEEAWKELCTQAAHPFSDSLPSMEEASLMFGYVSS